MKRFALLITLCLTLLISACQIEIDLDNQNYDANAYQVYNDFLAHDIRTATEFVEVMNHITYQVLPAVVVIHMDIIDAQTDDVISTRQGTGIIIEQTSSQILVLTSSAFTDYDITNQVNYDIITAKNDIFSGTVVFESKSQGLALLAFTKANAQVYPEIVVAPYISMRGEPLIFMGQQYHIKNAMTMGFITQVLEEDSQLEISIDAFEYGLGNIIVNLKGQLIGMYTYRDANQDDLVCVDFSIIQSFLALYQSTIEA